MNSPHTELDREWRNLVFPTDYQNPVPKPQYHLVVIGAGPAGLVIAIAAAGLGAKVALIEQKAMGGDCLNVGCVPSKALLEFTASATRPASFDDAFAHLRRVRTSIAHHDSVRRYAEAGVDVFLGHAKLVDRKTVSLGDVLLNGRRIVIATGAHASIPPIPGLREAGPRTNETIFDLQRLPQRLAILGAGPIGCELAQAFSRMGSEVHLLERVDRIMPTEAPRASETVAAALERDGVALHLGANVESVERSGSTVRIATTDGPVVADEVLVAAGRKANTGELNLAAAQVNVDDAGLIVVDHKLRTTAAGIFAAGDVCSRAQFTHNADAHARIVVQNALFAATASTKNLIIPHCTYTSPEVAQVGPLPAQLESSGIAFDRYELEFSELDRGKTQSDDEGYVEVLTEKDGDRILSATIVGHDAGEQIAPVCIAISNQLGLGGFSKTVLPYPTRAEYLRRLADTCNRGRLTPTVKRLMQTWFRWTG